MDKLLFLAQGLATGKHQTGPNRLLRLSLGGIALSICIMLISLAVIMGFKERVGDLAYSQTGHISLYPYGHPWTGTTEFISVPNETYSYLQEQPEIAHVCPILQQMPVVKTEEDFSAIILYGIDSLRFAGSNFSQFLSPELIGKLNDNGITRPLILPRRQAERLRLSTGDKVHLYFYGNKIQLRPFTLVGVYESGGNEQMPALCRDENLRSILRLDGDAYSRVLLRLHDAEASQEVAVRLFQRFGAQQEVSMQGYTLNTAEELLPDLFAWLELLDSNVIFLAIIILLIGIFTMISTVIILALDKTRHIGILKALGASNTYVRKIFTLIGLRLIALGLLWGNAIAFILLYIQRQWQPIKLNPEDYFMDAVPVKFDGMTWLLINVGAFALIGICIIFPTKIIATIRPSITLRYD